MDVELMQALTVDGDILPVIESEHRAWREAWDSDPLLGMSFEDWQWRRLVLFRKRLEEATESNAVIASAHWELCKRLEAAEKALEDMVRQFAYEGSKDGRPAYGTGGLSALEEAFSVLRWNDPQPALDRECQAAGCHKWASCGAPTRDGYRWLCGDHYAALAEEE